MATITKGKTTKQILDDIILIINTGEISEEYFEESYAFLKRKLNDNSLTDVEIKILKTALNDVASRIQRCANRL